MLTARVYPKHFWQVCHILSLCLPKCHSNPFPLPDLLLSFLVPILCSPPHLMLCFLIPTLSALCCLFTPLFAMCHAQRLTMPLVSPMKQVGHSSPEQHPAHSLVVWWFNLLSGGAVPWVSTIATRLLG